MTTDAVLKINPGTQAYDFAIDENGDIETEDFFDTSLLYSIFGERRASSDEVVDPRLRRGWIGNAEDFENGSKIWLFSQSRLTRDTLNRIEDEAQKALQWLVDDGFAVSIDQVTATLSKGRVNLDITIRRSRDRIVRRFFVLWENTGRAN
jgi:phage gp46-like protein